MLKWKLVSNPDSSKQAQKVIIFSHEIKRRVTLLLPVLYFHNNSARKKLYEKL